MSRNVIKTLLVIQIGAMAFGLVTAVTIYVPLLTALFLGLFQLILALVYVLAFWKRVTVNVRKMLKGYWVSVIAYFLGLVLINGDVDFDRVELKSLLVFGVPIVLAIFFTYITSQMKRQVEEVPDHQLADILDA